MKKRKVAECMNCREFDELAAYGLCFACYRKESRQRLRRTGPVDPHNAAIRSRHKKILGGFTSLMKGLADLGAPRTTVRQVRRLIQDLVEPIQSLLDSVDDDAADITEDDAGVSEQKPTPLFTVHNQASNGSRAHDNATRISD